MDATALKAWREGLGLKQKDAATLLGISIPTLASYETGRRPVSEKVAARAGEMSKAAEPRTEAEQGLQVIATEEKPPARPRAAIVNPGEFDGPMWDGTERYADKRTKWKLYEPRLIGECLDRDPLYAETAEEARLMRYRIAERNRVPFATIPAVPLKPIWRNDAGRPVNAAIPHPLGLPPARQYGWRSVMGAFGIYDFETAHPMHNVPA